MCPVKEFFEDYIPNADNNHITVADRRRIHVAGCSTLRIILGGHPVRLRNCLHVPDLDMFLLSTRIHRRRGRGCAFIADPTGCFLTFPSFIVPIDNTLECLVPCFTAPPTSTFDYDETNTRLVVDRLPTPDPGSLPDPALIKEYQKLMGSYVWLNTSTRPDLCVVIKLLTQFNANPLPAHLAAARYYVLQYI
jgi:hypothetical protein